MVFEQRKSSTEVALSVTAAVLVMELPPPAGAGAPLELFVAAGVGAGELLARQSEFVSGVRELDYIPLGHEPSLPLFFCALFRRSI
jgi:hypothetical protein